MKQAKQVKKEKDNYAKLTFLVPVILSVVDIIIVGAAMAVYASDPNGVTNVPLARLLVQAATILLTMSPPLLALTAGLALTHVKKHPNGSDFYKKAPMMISLVVWGCQTLYMAGLMKF